ncbi:E3 ubiquitin-protein ligase NHLRC1-like [Frankliniella occidentalis]|uniref:E3 ubiquitin-protein ligase NHLRC1-like n=1 Tax=Frankliniella occidentalis TaxID=133901 RepID=A0A6J1SVY7_FRAOC|nr:E3 ubiquitin-protein ligase NHLRC1-like [Frankliniella occidentalis]
MQCKVCDEEFDREVRAPKIVPCGHTVCLRCLQGGSETKCPTCNKVFDAAPASLLSNLTLLENLEQQGEAR